MRTNRTIVIAALAAAFAGPAASAFAAQFVSEILGRASTWEHAGATSKIVTGRSAADIMGRSSTLPATGDIRSVVVDRSMIEFGRS